MIRDENLTFQGHPGHSSNSADPGDRARDHDPRHPLRLQLRVQAAGSGEGDEQGIQSFHTIHTGSLMKVANISREFKFWFDTLIYF